MKGHHIAYTAKELAWIEAYAGTPRREAHAAFCRAFGRSDVSLINYTALCKRHGWFTGRTGRFEAGLEPHNKGKPMPYHPNSAATRFKPGGRSGKAAKLWKPVGSERLSKNGYLERKIHDGMPMHRRWRAVHLIRWEEIHGPLPRGHALKCLDGNRLNTDPANWIAVPRALLPRLAGRFGRGYDGAPAEVKPVILAVTQLEHRARERKKGS